MKIKIEVDEQIEETELLIQTPSIGEELQMIQKALSDVMQGNQKIACYRNETEYYLLFEDILFFETDAKAVYAHTSQEIYSTNYRLYELEAFLPAYFMRVSKSTICNTKKIYSITRNLTASSLVEFRGSHKQVYVSRNYYKALKERLEEKRK